MNTATAMPNTTELVHRIHRMAKLVVHFVDDPSDDSAPVALALWEILTGCTTPDEAIRYARKVAAPGWPSDHLNAS